MARSGDPVVLDLASLPREQTGPFLLLGLDKTADKERIEANWADRVRWARKGQLKIPLEDVNWARNTLTERESRLRADSASLNVDLTEAVLGRLAYRFGVGGQRGSLRWRPLDREKDFSDYAPPAELPDAAAVAASVVPPEIPDELPAVRALLDQLAAAPLDPWNLELPDPREVHPQTAAEETAP
jgi:hypothetical protein